MKVAREKVLIRVVIVVSRQSKLSEVIGAFDPPGSLAYLLNCWQQHADDGNDDQQLDQSERLS